ncbi:MAG: EutN/CcmL family microcompartment protein [Cyanobacteria bacterium NC_groundwater_1444_Ag_S-0.65um_54_12]|nr:EutN/CcmL family microcompartment protein [Cyanobacteria bacterium NC_groundwater_1444_Ag_S-0.65um_54_12]
MLIGKIVGTLVAEQKDPKLVGTKLLVVRQLDVKARETEGYVIAADTVGAGVGEVILYATGSSARQTLATENKPIDATIMAIVDTWEVYGEVMYTSNCSPCDNQLVVR